MGGAVKAVKKVFKKVAPVVLPIALNAIPSVGPIMAATMGSGIGTLISGGSFKQALMAGAMGAAFSGGITSLAGKFGPASGFGGNSLLKGIGNLSQKMVNMTGGPGMQDIAKGGISSRIGTGIRALKTNLSKGLGSLVPKGVKDAFGRVATKFEYIKQTPQARELGYQYAGPTSKDMLAYGETGIGGFKEGTKSFWEQGKVLPTTDAATKAVTGGLDIKTQLDTTPYKTGLSGAKFLGETIGGEGEGLSGFAQDASKVADTGDTDKTSLWKKITGGTADWWKGLSPLKKTAVAGLGAAGLYAGYKALTTKEIEEMSPEQINQRIQSIGSATDPRYVSQFNPTGMYSSYPGRITRNLFAYDFPTTADTGPYLQPWTPAAKGGIMNAAGGGFPRRTGQINGPGTGTSDDVPAMLSDGEFVMTARAVRNAGGGSRAAGARRMYNLMNNLERGVA